MPKRCTNIVSLTVIGAGSMPAGGGGGGDAALVRGGGEAAPARGGDEAIGDAGTDNGAAVVAVLATASGLASGGLPNLLI